MIVVDTNIIAYRFIQGDKTNLVLKAQDIDCDWIVPELWKHEFLNVLSTLTKNDLLEKKQAIEIYSNAYRILRRFEKPVSKNSALVCSIDFMINAYDAQYIVLAKSLGLKCLTEDKKVLKTFPQIAISLKQFINK